MTLRLLLGLLLVSPALAEENWPGLLGPTQQGHSDAVGLPTSWSETKNIKWKTAMPGVGWSSAVIYGGQIWMTTATDEGRSLRAVCVDRESGKIIHDVQVFAVGKPAPKSDANSYASPTPVVEQGRVYVCFGADGTACLDTATAKPAWINQELKVDHSVGAGSSPILYKDSLILHCDGIDVQYIVALDKNTGKILWKTKRSYDFAGRRVTVEERKAFGTPVLATINGTQQLLSLGSRRLYAYDPADGRELWSCDHPGYSNAPLPVVGRGMVYFSSGYYQPELLAIRTAKAAGDVTNHAIAWRYKKNVNLKPSMLLVDGALYMVSDTGQMTCLDAKTGSVLWEHRLGGLFSASPLYADGRIYLFSERGACIVMKPARAKAQVLATSKLSDGCMATPAISGKAMFVRTKTSLYRIEQ